MHRSSLGSELDRLIATGATTSPTEDGDQLENCREIRIAAGIATKLIDSDRGVA